MNKLYVFTYESLNNQFKGEIGIESCSLVEAQDKFLEWLRKQPTYQHMWNLQFNAREIKREGPA